MSHPAQLAFIASVKERFPEMFQRKQVLEVGSLNINGSIRAFFEQCTYIGVDLARGPCVDVVARGEDLTYSDGFFDVVASCECFEHIPDWAKIFNNMVRMSSKLVFFTCATTGRAEHGTNRSNPADSPFTAHDYYGNVMEEDIRRDCDLSQFSSFEFTTNEDAKDLYFWGFK